MCLGVVLTGLLAYRWHMHRHMPEGALELPDKSNAGKAVSDTSETPDIMQQFRQKVPPRSIDGCVCWGFASCSSHNLPEHSPGSAVCSWHLPDL